MAEFKQQEIKIVKEGDPIGIDRAVIRYSVRSIHIETNMKLDTLLQGKPWENIK